MVKNECEQFAHWTLKLTLSQERTDGTDFFHAGTVSYKFKVD